MDTRRTAGEYDSTGMKCLYILQIHIEGVNLTIDLAHPDSPGNQLSVLRTEVQYENFLTMDVPHGFDLSMGAKDSLEKAVQGLSLIRPSLPTLYRYGWPSSERRSQSAKIPAETNCCKSSGYSPLSNR